MICNECKNETLKVIYDKTKKEFVCRSCLFVAPSDSVHVIQKEYIRGYGNVESSRIRELKRRVILPDTPKDGTLYYVGRRGENGKITDRLPNY